MLGVGNDPYSENESLDMPRGGGLKLVRKGEGKWEVSQGNKDVAILAIVLQVVERLSTQLVCILRLHLGFSP